MDVNKAVVKGMPHRGKRRHDLSVRKLVPRLPGSGVECHSSNSWLTGCHHTFVQ